MRNMKTALAVGVCLAVCVAGSAWAAVEGRAPAPPVAWPEEWTAFGPYTIKRMHPYKYPMLSDLLPGKSLKTIPAELVIGTNRYAGQPLRLTSDLLDLNAMTPPSEHGAWPGGRTVYLLAPVTAAADTTIQIGAGANWWMQWWLDGEPAYSTVGPYGNGALTITGRDHVFDLFLPKGEHILAVAVIGGLKGFGVAVTSPQALCERPVTFQEALAAGRRKYQPIHGSVPIHYAAARNDFRRAIEAAGTDVEQAEARLALADNDRADIWNRCETNAPTIRREYEAVLALSGALAEQKARAERGIGETYLLENDGVSARRAFERALALAGPPGWTNVIAVATARAHMLETNYEAARACLSPLVEPDAGNRAVPAWRIEARQLLPALELQANNRIRPDRPRLFFNADTWPAVRARVAADTGSVARLAHALNTLPDDIEVRDWGSTHYFQVGGAWQSHPDLMTVALAYRMTGGDALLGKIRKILRATMDHYLRLADYNAHMETRVCFLAALDWVWNDLPPDERNGLVRDLLRYAYGWHVQRMLMGRTAADPYYYFPNMHWYVGLAALNPGLDPVDTLRALTVLGRGYDNNVVTSFGGRLALMKDRGMVTRVDYAFNDLPTPAWTFLNCWRSAIGPVPVEWAFASGLAPSCVLRNMLGFDQGRYRHFGYANSWRARGGWQSASLLYDNLGRFIYFFSDTEPEEAAIAAWLRQRMEAAGCVGLGHYLIDRYVTDLDDAPPARLPKGLPLARYYPANGMVLMSSGFEPNESTYALFCCGGGQSVHEQFDTGHFTIFKKGFLALDSGTRALTGEYERQSVAHNTVLIRMPGEVFEWGRTPFQSNSGGQRYLPTVAVPLAFETGPLFAYAATDATATYHSNKCARAVRQFLYLPPDHFVVFDRVEATRAEYAKTWLLHVANEPAIAGKECRADQEEGRIFCRTLLPADAVLEPIGGPGKEFWADGKNWPIPPRSEHVKELGMKDASDIPENMGRWRVEVTPGAARAEDVFLHLIQTAEQTVERMVESRVREADGQVELSFPAGARDVTITFRTAGDVGGRIRIAEGARVLADRELTREIMTQSGLALAP